MGEEKTARLPDAELDVMLTLWGADGALGKSGIAEILSAKRGWSASTVQVLLHRLMERGYVECVREKRLCFYKPLIREEEYRSRETKTFFERIHRGNVKNLFAALVDSGALNDGDLTELEQMLERKRR